MPIRPVSFLAQAAAQRQQTRENDKTREFQKEQALRDFGMNIGQSIIASLGNFGASAGADAIRFNREEPYKMLTSGVNPAPEVSVKQPVGTGAADMLSKAAMARSPLQPQTPVAEAPAPMPKAPPAPMRQAAPVARPAQPAGPPQEQAPAFDPYKAMRDPSSVLPRQAAPAPSAPTPAPLSTPAPQRPSAPPSAREEVVSQSTSQRGDAPEAQAVKLRALQEMEKITQRWLSGEPLQFVNKDGTPADPREAAFAEAHQMKQDLTRLDMLSKAGLIEAEEAKAVAYRIKSMAEGGAATTKSESDRQLKIAQANKFIAEAGKASTGNYDKRGNELSNAINEVVITSTPGEFPTAHTVEDKAARPRGGGTGGAPKQSAMFPDATEVFAQGYSTTKTNERGQPLVGEKVLPEDYLATVPGQPQLFKYIFKKDAPAIDEALKTGDWQAAQSLFKNATAEHASQWDASRETVASPADALKATEGAEKAKRAEEAKTAAAKLAAGSRAQKAREDAVKEADAAQARLVAAPKEADLFPALDAEDAGIGYSALKRGASRPKDVPVAEWQSALGQWNKWLKAKAVYENRIPAALKKFKENGGTEEQFYELVPRDESGQPAPGPSEQSPGQFPPPGDESKVDDLFQKIESQPWSAERKRRVFLARAREAGLA